jgi:Fic family protein
VPLKDGWHARLDFFLEGVRVQSLDAIERARALVELREHYREILQQKRARPALHAVAEHLFARPVFSIRQLERELSLSYAAINRAVGLPAGLGWIVETTGQKRIRVFAALEVLQILNSSGQ